MTDHPLILTINAGSSSIKFDVFQVSDTLERAFSGAIEGIGSAAATLSVAGTSDTDTVSRQLPVPDFAAATTALTDWIQSGLSGRTIAAVGHRVVHGGPTYQEACIITEEVMAELQKLVPFDPQHLPLEIQLITSLQAAFSTALHVACFDTAFHRDMPTEARLFPIPRKYEAQGVRRYGFHGLSYAYIMQQLEHVEGTETARGRVVIAHLGSGASLAAVRHGKSIDTSMGFSPMSGIPMSTRSGDLDPGLVLYLDQHEQLTTKQFEDMIASQSGLLGVSELTADMKQLLTEETTHTKAADAVNLFCYQVKKYIGAYAAALGGIDTLIFTGGIGEQAPKIRAQVCQGLEFLGIEFDSTRNQSGAEIISSTTSPVKVRVMHTDEAMTIVGEVTHIMKNSV